MEVESNSGKESADDDGGDYNLEICEIDEEEMFKLNGDVENVDSWTTRGGSMFGACKCSYCNKTFVKERQLRGHLRQHTHLISKSASGNARRLRRRMQQQARREAKRVELDQINDLPSLYETFFSSEFVVAQLNECDAICAAATKKKEDELIDKPTSPPPLPSSPFQPPQLYCESDDFEVLAVGAVENKFTCPLCPATCYNRSGLGAHMRMHKMSPGKRLTASQIRNVKRRRGRVSCPHCGKDYSRSDQIPRHIRHNCPVAMARGSAAHAEISTNSYTTCSNLSSSNDYTTLPISKGVISMVPRPSLALTSLQSALPCSLNGIEEIAMSNLNSSSAALCGEDDDTVVECCETEVLMQSCPTAHSRKSANRRKSRKPMKIVDGLPAAPITIREVISNLSLNLPSPSVGEAPVFFALEDANQHCSSLDESTATSYFDGTTNSASLQRAGDSFLQLPSTLSSVKEIALVPNGHVMQYPSKSSISDDFRLSCDTCLKIFKDSRSLGVHRRSAHGIFGARHFRNHRVRLTIEELNALKEAHAYGTDTCVSLKKQLQQLAQLNEQRDSMVAVVDSESFACSQCGDILPSKKGLSNHLRTHRAEEPALESAPNDSLLLSMDAQVTPASASPSQLVTLRIYNINDPSRIGSQLRASKNDDCSNATTAATELSAPWVPEQRHLEDAAEKLYHCDVCNRGFKSAHNLGAHNYQVHGIFGRRLKHKQYLNEHKKERQHEAAAAVTTQTPPTQCDEQHEEDVEERGLVLDLAEESVSEPPTIAAGEEQEEGEVTFQIVESRDMKNDAAVADATSHSFACPHCSAVCYTKSGLGAHMRIHRKSPHGELTAAQLSNLRRRKGRVCCPHCSKDYSRSDQIARHIRHNCPAFEGLPTNAKRKSDLVDADDVAKKKLNDLNLPSMVTSSTTCRLLLPKKPTSSPASTAYEAAKGVFQCDRCSKAFHTAWNLDQHRFHFHRIGTAPDPAEHPNRVVLFAGDRLDGRPASGSLLDSMDCGLGYD